MYTPAVSPMRKRTIVFLALGTILAALSGGVAGFLLLVLANPGTKGPHVSDEGLLAAFAIGALVGGGLVVGTYRLHTRPRKRPPWMDGDST